MSGQSSMTMQNGNGVKQATRCHETSDTFEASAFMCKGHRPTLEDRGQRVIFRFEQLPEDLILALETDSMVVSPVRFKAAYKALLSRLHHERR